MYLYLCCVSKWMNLWYNTAIISGVFTMCRALWPSSQPLHKEVQLLYPFYRPANWVTWKLNNLSHHLLAFNLCMSDSSAHQNSLLTQMYPKTQLAYINRASPGLAKGWASNMSGALCTAGPLLALLLPRGEALRSYKSLEYRDLDPFPLVGNGPKLKTNTLK